MAFVDTLLTDTDATVALVDRRHVPGGHWNDAYPFVRLHQPSAYYGVASRQLGRDRKDESGPNRGFYELASGVEVAAYFHDVMETVFLPSGRVHHVPLNEFRPSDQHPGGGEVVSLLSGTRTEITWNRLVNATLLSTSIPLLHQRRFEVAPGVVCEPPNHLPRLAGQHTSIVILGAGKTAIDSVTWLLSHGYPPDRITWVMPRDSWLINRATVQPGIENFEASIGSLAAQTEICADATSVDELCRRMEAEAIWLRLDPDVWPEMFHSATISEREMAAVGQVDRIVRRGRVSAVDHGRLVVADGEVATDHGALHVDCTASAAADNVNRRPAVFAPDMINVQMVRPFQPCFSAALIAHIEATVDDGDKADLARPTPMTDTVDDWLDVHADGLANAGAWSLAPTVAHWLGTCRLNAFVGMNIGDDPGRKALFDRVVAAAPGAIANLRRLAAECGQAASTTGR